MSTARKIEWYCCGQSFECIVWDAVNRELSPERYHELLDGKLNQITCPNCGQTVPHLFPVLVHDMAKHLMIWVYEGPDDPLDEIDEEEFADSEALGTSIVSVEGYSVAAELLRMLDISPVVEEIREAHRDWPEGRVYAEAFDQL